MVSQVAARERNGDVGNTWYAQAPATGMQAGDYMFMHVSVDTTIGEPHDYPAGWDQFHKGGDSGIGYMVCGKLYEVGDHDKEWSGSHSGGTEGYCGVIEVFRGLEPVSIISALSVEGSADSVPIPPLTLTTTADDDNFYSLNMGASADGDIGFPSNYPSNQNEYIGTGDVNNTGSSVTCCKFDHQNKSRPAGNYDHSSDNDTRVMVILGFNGGTLPLPVTPTGLAAVATGLSADITWNDAADALSWTLEKSLTGGAPWTVLADQTTVRAYQDLPLTSGETYWYRVKAINVKGESSYATTSVNITYVPSGGGGADTIFLGSTAIASDKLKLGSTAIDAVHLGSTKIWPVAGGDPNAPTTVTLTIADPNLASLEWTASTGALYYRVYRSTTQNGTYTEIASNITGLNYFDTPSAGTYWYKVDAVGVYGPGQQSNSASAIVSTATGFIVVASDFVDRAYQWTIPPECQAGDILLVMSTAAALAGWDEGSVVLTLPTQQSNRDNWTPGYKVLQAGDIGGTIATVDLSGNAAYGFGVLVVRPNGTWTSISAAQDYGQFLPGMGAITANYTPPNTNLGVGLWVGHCESSTVYSISPDATLIKSVTFSQYFWVGSHILPANGSQTQKTGTVGDASSLWARSAFIYVTIV